MSAPPGCRTAPGPERRTGYSPVSDAGAGYYATLQLAPSLSIFLKAQVAHSYGSESIAPGYDKHTKGLVQIGMSASSPPTHGGLFTEAPSPQLGERLASLLRAGPVKCVMSDADLRRCRGRIHTKATGGYRCRRSLACRLR